MYNPASWTDHDGNFWLFGGSKGNNTYSALWKFNVLTNEWTWINGSQLPNQCGVYGVIGVPSPDNSPGARGAALLSWTDTNGDLWLYGGYAFCSAIDGDRNDLWRYSISTNEWTWMDGSDSNVYLDPIYGNYQVPASDNNPGSLHENTAAWTDSLGNFWLYSGGNSSCIGTAMWKYDVGVNDWVWMQGSQGCQLAPSYGIKGISDSLNSPGSRLPYAHWTDENGNFWLWGGYAGYNHNVYCDLWKFNVNSNEWTWISGTDTIGAEAVFTQYCESSNANHPAAGFENGACWKDSCGNFWVYGGCHDYMSNTTNDLWVYRVGNDDWTLVKGSTINNQIGFYGIQGTPSDNNYPGEKNGALAWIDTNGNLWLFGGMNHSAKRFNDLWKFEINPQCPQITCYPIIDFIATSSKLCEKYCNDFLDQSTNNPTSWQWIFPGGTPSSSTDQNPTNICYNEPGAYDVTLITTNANGSDTLTLHDYITVYPTPPIPIITQNGYALTSSQADFYQWQLNTVDIPGATNQSYEVLQTGFYTVVVSDSNSCVNSTTLYVEITGIDEWKAANILVFPNPSEGIFTIHFGNGASATEVTLEVTDAIGKSVYLYSANQVSQNQIQEMDLRQLPHGIYFLTIRSSGFTLLRKIVIG
ncbi:MAG: T9SS type A sorting domain-containing protein [Bacteroidetes bacterium]|nr:T9SS type A sorting domain-containing protein [Bacteroidota bacterium]